MASCVWKLSLPLPFDLLLEPAAAAAAAAAKSQVLRNENSVPLRVCFDSFHLQRELNADSDSIRFGIEIGVRPYIISVCVAHKGLVRVRMNANLYI